MKERGGRPSAFIAFECLGTLMKHDTGVFGIASQPCVRNSGKWKYSQYIYKLSASLLFWKNCIVMVICLFRKGVTNVITMMWMIIESSFNFEFFTLFCNDFIREPITKISSMLRKTPLFCSFSGNSQSERFPIALIGHP